MKFMRKNSDNGPLLVISDMNPGEWKTSDIAGQLTIGGDAYATAINEYNGMNATEPYSDIVALPYSWLNDAGRAYFNSADDVTVSTPLNTGNIGKINSLTPLQLVMIAAGVLLVITSILSERDRT